MAFSKLKALLRKAGARTFTDLFEALGNICDLFTPTECWNYFQAAGNASGQNRKALDREPHESKWPEFSGLPHPVPALIGHISLQTIQDHDFPAYF